jgi:hypothetical protein
MPDDFQVCDSSKFRGLESNQRPLGSEPSVTTSSNCPGANLQNQDNGAAIKFGEKGSNLRLLVQSQAAYR